MTSKTPKNRAAWIQTKPESPLEIRETPYTKPGKGQVVIRNHAAAINPVDWILQVMGGAMFRYLKYPIILGFDVAGEVVEVGEDVTTLAVGDRVVGTASGLDKIVNDPTEAGFQEYVVLRTVVTSKLPDSISYVDACVLPLGLATAATGLYSKNMLALSPPKPHPKPNGETIVIWGGSTSVGNCAIQMAVASGYEVVTTCSPRNFDKVKKLGAAYAFDYNSKTTIKDIIEVLKDKKSAGALAIGNLSTEACIEIVAASKGKKFVAQASQSLRGGMPSTRAAFLSALPSFLYYMFMAWLKCKWTGVGAAFIWGGEPVGTEVGPMVFNNFLPEAMAEGTFVPAPEAQVVGHGLESLQEAFDIQKRGVSAKKIVITL